MTGPSAMPTAEARVRTDRASRYLSQLCEHTARVSTHALGDQHHPRHGEGPAVPTPRHAEHSDTQGVIEFDAGRCILRATAEELILVAEADDQHHLRLVQDALTARLQQIGRRDHLTVTWRPI